MSAPPPIPCVFLKGAFHPLKRAQNLAAAHYGEGEVLVMAPVEERSEVSHRHEFAWLHDAWMNLPEHLADQFPSKEHLRKRALIDAGFYNESIIDAGSNAAALRVAAFLRSKDDFALIIVRGPLVVERVAKSQSRRAMNKAEFQASKEAVLETVSAMIGVSPETLRHQPEAA